MDGALRERVRAELAEAEQEADRLAIQAAIIIQRWEEAIARARDLRDLLALDRDRSAPQADPLSRR